METGTPDLGHYMAKCHYGSSSSSSSNRKGIFKHSSACRPPLLRDDRPNRIIWYPGAFNPPHRGHEAFIRHCFENTQDINVIAVIILPRDDDWVTEKYSDQPGRVLFTKEERVRLWRCKENVNDLHEWSMVYDRSEDEFDSFQKRLIKRVKAAGFELRFMLAMGPDYLSCHGRPGWFDYDMGDGIVVSDVARSADFTNGKGGKLERLAGCVPWEHVTEDKEAMRQQVKRHAKSLQECTFQHDPERYDAKLKKDPYHFEKVADRRYRETKRNSRKVMVCHSKRDRHKRVRFIPAAGTVRASAINTRGISATRVEKVLSKLKRAKRGARSLAAVMKELESLVLDPEILVKVCDTNARRFKKFTRSDEAVSDSEEDASDSGGDGSDSDQDGSDSDRDGSDSDEDGNQSDEDGSDSSDDASDPNGDESGSGEDASDSDEDDSD
ncbi:hypothetical protein H2200_013209 [Cladophialophora chaetospira]|uniref:Cytidyltransferase-like domain-containing protein n=1 Tax=Cladophialophora chaetospira TaxID=386627 RepID=A0AA38WWD7_9EURO|nr:hypothetical protein H2200_013209 [Cladophialophora chaetospira]